MKTAGKDREKKNRGYWHRKLEEEKQMEERSKGKNPHRQKIGMSSSSLINSESN